MFTSEQLDLIKSKNKNAAWILDVNGEMWVVDYKDMIYAIHWLDTSSHQSKWHKFGMTWWGNKWAKGMLKDSRNIYICLFLFETCINLEYSEQSIFKANFLLQDSILFRCTDTHIGTSLNFAHCQFIQASRCNQISQRMPAPADWMNKHLLCQSGKGTEKAACRLNKAV